MRGDLSAAAPVSQAYSDGWERLQRSGQVFSKVVAKRETPTGGQPWARPWDYPVAIEAVGVSGEQCSTGALAHMLQKRLPPAWQQ